ncbi:alpha/beta fold hydrolase [Streptomyces niveus]|uniref:alpha/beta fold hydrolase n=1 Tax=Streptomyces niveus TaxID=193462 RepID=UPI00342E245B
MDPYRQEAVWDSGTVASLYRSAEARQEIRDWCTTRINQWPAVHRTAEISTRAGPTHLVVANEDAQRPSGAPAVVLLPGTNFNAATSLVLATELARHWTTYLLDVPGQPGLSSPNRPSRHRLPFYGQWLGDVLDQAVGRPAILVGHSLGGGIALACDSPLIRGRVLISPAGLARLSVDRRVVSATLPWLLRPTDNRSTRLLRMMSGPHSTPGAELTAWMTLVARNCRSSLAPAPLPPHVVAQARNTVNLVATGEHDIFLPPARLRTPATRGLHTRVHVLPGTGHLATDEAPQRISTLVAEAVRRSTTHP